jgi:hypothetical protein
MQLMVKINKLDKKALNMYTSSRATVTLAFVRAEGPGLAGGRAELVLGRKCGYEQDYWN